MKIIRRRTNSWLKTMPPRGLIIETISRSAVWKESIILLTEDDAQKGPDHIYATRTGGLCNRTLRQEGASVHDRYDQLSMLRTIEILLGLPALNMNDALAVPMFGIFAGKPDHRTYTPTRVSVVFRIRTGTFTGSFPGKCKSVDPFLHPAISPTGKVLV